MRPRHATAQLFDRFFQSESASGILLIASALLAFVWVNSPLSASYLGLQHWSLGGEWGPIVLKKSLHHWVNDGLMAVFFFLVGLEIKRELRIGELSDRRRAALPALAALGGMIVPALIFVGFNSSGDTARGWGIPMATDIAFALGVLRLAGPAVPHPLKVFLAALAIVDDLGAVLVVALFYTEQISAPYLVLAAAPLLAASLYGSRGGARLTVYAGLGLLLWYFMLKSGVHATVAGVLLALTVPLRPAGAHARPAGTHAHAASAHAARGRAEAVASATPSPLERAEHGLQRPCAFVIMPLFALMNAGLLLEEASSVGRISAGVFVGLLLGKPLGILGMVALGIRAGWTALPRGVSIRMLTGAACLAGIGFTMSLFISTLAYAEPSYLAQAKVGVLAASVIAALLGLLVTRASLAQLPRTNP
ncbi:MAG: Na+/H+ antiporter NhaA [Candidatus Eisenbacteria bacterium]|nr:Na+/H+ antiporter NhaA [Candidatus Eisenbacteria bacterium]